MVLLGWGLIGGVWLLIHLANQKAGSNDHGQDAGNQFTSATEMRTVTVAEGVPITLSVPQGGWR
jgi:hypothetical protein